MYKDQFFCLKVLVGGPPFQHQRHLSSKLPWQNLTTILLSSVCLDVQSASSFLPTSPPKFLQPRGTDHPITNCRRLRRSRENFLRKSCPEFLQRSVDRISKTYVARDSDLQGGKGGGGGGLHPSVPHTPNLHCLNLKWPDSRSRWQQEVKVAEEHLAGTIASVNTSTSVTPSKPHCIGQ